MGSDTDAARSAHWQELTPQSQPARGRNLAYRRDLPLMPGPLVQHMQRVCLSVQALFISGFAQVILDPTEKPHDGVSPIDKPCSDPVCSPRSTRYWEW
jgi:hypothetical protein